MCIYTHTRIYIYTYVFINSSDLTFKVLYVPGFSGFNFSSFLKLPATKNDCTPRDYVFSCLLRLHNNSVLPG